MEVFLWDSRCLHICLKILENINELIKYVRVIPKTA